MEADYFDLGSETLPNLNEERILIDTSAPFESVKEAVTRFEVLGFCKSLHRNLSTLEQQATPEDEHDTGKLEEEAAVLEKELILKEKETINVLKELESTKRLIEDLKSKLQKEECGTDLKNREEDKENQVNQLETLTQCLSSCPVSKPGLILMELKQAKFNLTKTINDVADVRASVVWLNKKLEKERASLERTRERLTHNSSKLSSLEQELSQTRLRLQVAKDDPSDITKELHRLCSEAEHFKRMGEAAKSEVLRTVSEIERTKCMIGTAELRLVAARKMKEAARAVESASLAEINALSNNLKGSPEVVTLSFEEYNALTFKALEAEENSKRKVTDAMLQVDVANLSKTEILKRVEEATKEVQICKKDLEEAMERVGIANRGKLAVEEALRKCHKRRPSSVRNSNKFKNSHPSSHHQRDSLSVGVNGSEMEDEEAKPNVPKTVLSIGEILSRKLLLSQDFEEGSLGHMIGRQKDDSYFCKQFCAKRKKFGFAGLSHLLGNKQKKKKPTLNLR